jgi:hypothetical protein
MLLCLSDYGFAAARPLITQLQMLVSALWFHSNGLVVIPWGLLLQCRTPDPGLNLPFLFFQILALARARERPMRLNLLLSGWRSDCCSTCFFTAGRWRWGAEYRFSAGSRSAQSLRRNAMHRRCDRSAAVATQYPSESPALGRSDEAVRLVRAGAEILRQHHPRTFSPCPGSDRLVDLEVEEIRPALLMEPGRSRNPAEPQSYSQWDMFSRISL